MASTAAMKTSGWDVAMTHDDEVRIMEWNAGHSDIKFSEATIGPCFRGLGWEDRWRQGRGMQGVRRSAHEG